MKKMNMRKKEAIHGLLFVSPWIIGFLAVSYTHLDVYKRQACK